MAGEEAVDVVGSSLIKMNSFEKEVIVNDEASLRRRRRPFGMRILGNNCNCSFVHR